jgi:hypothetical protein
VHGDPGVALAGNTSVREIRFDLELNDEGCGPFECTLEDSITGPVRFHRVGEELEVCLTSQRGIDAPADLLDCSTTNGGDDDFTITNVSALDSRLRPMSPPPVVVNDPND